METKHTAGPWNVVEHSWSDTSVYPGNHHPRICVLSIGDIATEETQFELEGEMNANARLIAAAPDLLEALTLCEEELALLAEMFPQQSKQRKAALENARSAIAKALSPSPVGLQD